MKYLLKIIFNEQQELNQEQLVQKIMEFLLEQGFPGATVRRGTAGLDYEGEFSNDLLEDNYFNNLPLLLEAVADAEQINRVKDGLKDMIEHGQITLIKNVETESASKENEYWVVKIYTNEKKARIIDRDEAEKILAFLHEKEVIWATVSKGISGFGRSGEIHSQHLFSVGGHLPLIIEFVVNDDKLQGIIEELKSMVHDGILFKTPVELLQNK